MNLTEKLIYLRKKQGLTQVELAEKLDVSRQAVSKWESEVTVPSLDNLKTLGKFYGVSMDYLLNDELEQFETSKKETTAQSDCSVWSANRMNKQRILAILLACFLLLTVSLMAKKLGQSNDGRSSVPLNDLQTDFNDDSEYTPYTFSLE